METTLKEMEKPAKSDAFRKLGFSKEETAQVVESLNILLANYHVHYQKLRNFHWNVKGHDFFDLHEKFEIFYNKAKENIDDIAERIRVFGHTPMSTLKEYLKTANIEEQPTDFPSDKMVEEVLQDFRDLVSYMYDAHEEAMEIGDIGTIDMLNGFVKGMEKDHWMMTAFLDK